MTQAIKWIYLVTLAAWIGSILFFSFIVAPTVFKTLQPQDAGLLIRRIFSKYYLLGIGCSAVALTCVTILLAKGSFPTMPAVLSLLLLAGMGGTDVWMRQSVMPHMNEIRDRVNEARAAGKEPEPELKAEWDSLHGLSVKINGAVLLCGLALLFLVVYRAV